VASKNYQQVDQILLTTDEVQKDVLIGLCTIKRVTEALLLVVHTIEGVSPCNEGGNRGLVASLPHDQGGNRGLVASLPHDQGGISMQ
jgi:hypothetical protein